MADTLRPGFWVTRRDEATVQVGLDRSVTLPDSPETRDVLDRLENGFPVRDEPVGAEIVGALRRRDLLVDTRDLRHGPRWVHATYAADAPRRLAARVEASACVQELGGQPESADWAGEVAALLESTGIATTTGRDPAATVALLLSSGEPDRELLDPLLVTGQPHLLVVAHEGSVRIGPFVLPGSTACLRCVDAHLAEVDGRRGVVLQQLVGRSSPADPVALAAAAALAVRDVVAYVDGDRPATWSTTTTLGSAPGLEQRAWRRHPHCGCCWGDLLDLTS